MTIIWDRPDTQLPPDIGGWLPRLKHVCVQIRGCYVPAWTGTWTLRKLRERENVEPMVMLRALGMKALMGLEGLRSFEVVVLRSGEFKTLWVSGEWEVWRRNLEKLGTWVRLRVVEGDVFCKM
ncbi:hypothetical protein Tdes44962_MAKER01563 [Teratosphaeria destructans]|uniref:Uncharacterized protein n=1 Tax=Teratosphaeria destructans TaxID=418781 RepID=A0A9W7SZ00_9PEZI|nr:hypothetical protein Tdes44962_MAKER01563 [Teratosphaeria destructans]